MAVTNKDIAAWKASLDKNYNKIKADYAKAKAAGDKAKMKTLGKKMKSNLKDDKTWTNLAAAEKALGAKNMPPELARMCTELHWLQAFDPDR